MHNEPVVSEAELSRLVNQLADDPVGALSSLSLYAKKLAPRDIIDRLLADRSPVYAVLSGGEPKARKNAARLLGALARERDAGALVSALKSEDTRFVIPSILLALGGIGGDLAKTTLNAYVPPTAADETEVKHVTDILEAHRKALAALQKDIPLPPRTRLTAPMDVLLVPPHGFQQVLLKEAFVPRVSDDAAGG